MPPRREAGRLNRREDFQVCLEVELIDRSLAGIEDPPCEQARHPVNTRHNDVGEIGGEIALWA